jgi:hypothetical protein
MMPALKSTRYETVIAPNTLIKFITPPPSIGKAKNDTHEKCSEVKYHLGSHLPTPVTRLYTQHTNRHPEVASSNTTGEGDGCKGKLDL